MSATEHDAEAFSTPQAVNREITLVDSGNCCYTRTLGERDERRIGVIAGQARVLGDDPGKRRVIRHRLHQQQAGRAGTLEPEERCAQVGGAGGQDVGRLRYHRLGRQQLTAEALESFNCCGVVAIRTVDEGDDRAGINESAGHETPCAQARGRCRTAAP